MTSASAIPNKSPTSRHRASTAAGPADGTHSRRGRCQQRDRPEAARALVGRGAQLPFFGDLRRVLSLLLYTQPVGRSKNGSADGAGNQRSRKDSHLRGAGEVRVRECQPSDE
jgi:hypothetical protein